MSHNRNKTADEILREERRKARNEKIQELVSKGDQKMRFASHSYKKVMEEINKGSEKTQQLNDDFYLTVERFNAAIDFYKQAIEIDRGKMSTKMKLGESYLELGKLYQGMQQLQNASDTFKLAIEQLRVANKSLQLTFNQNPDHSEDVKKKLEVANKLMNDTETALKKRKGEKSDATGAYMEYKNRPRS